MQGAKARSSLTSFLNGIPTQSSVYGATIMVLYGRTRVTPLLIWANNLRQSSGSSKAIKSKKSGTPTYVEAADLLIGTNPIVSPLQFWNSNNNNAKMPLNFQTSGAGILYSATITNGVTATVTIPDTAFYCLLGVTLTLPYNVTFNDYGGQGTVNLSGNFELPLWNAAFAGPNPVNASAWRFYPYVFRWIPGVGTVGVPNAIRTIDIDLNAKGAILGPLGLTTATINLYYAQVPTTGHIPLSDLRLTYEPELGNGPEYSGFSSQQIFYPQFAGFGSPNLDCGISQQAPNLIPEVLGAFPVYPTGDADFADMIEDIFRGVGQAAFIQQTQSQNFSSVHHGLESFDYPGMIQKKLRTSSSAFTSLLTDLAINAGDILIIVARNDNGAPLTISDTFSSTFFPQISGPPNNYQVWVASLGAEVGDTFTIGPSGVNTDIQFMELGGLDTLSTTAVFSGTGGPIAGSITVGPTNNLPIYVLAIVIAESGATNVQPATPPTHWQNVMVGQGLTFSMGRIVRTPGPVTIPFSVQPSFTGNWHLVLLQFTNSQPVPWAQPLGEVLDDTSMQLVRAQCRAGGLWGSLVMDSQQKASDSLQMLYDAADAAPVWSGFKLLSVPYSEVSAVGNGAVYTAPTALGPVATLTESDLVGDSSKKLIKVSIKSRIDLPNILYIQHPSRFSDYNDVTPSYSTAAPVSLFGPRKASPKPFRCIQDPDIAQLILGIMARRQNYSTKTYTMTANAKFGWLLPMNVILANDAKQGIVNLPVRITSVEETETYDLTIEAELFLYGVYSPQPVTIGTGAPYSPSTTYIPSAVNTPVIFEPVPGLVGFPNVNELRFVVSNQDALYGGCDVYISTDGGNSFNFLETVFGNGVTGFTAADWQQSPDPDESDVLLVNLSESNGVIPAAYSLSDKDNFVYPYYVQAVVAWTDLASVAGTKVLTSITGGFSQGMVGLLVVITSGTNFVPGTYAVASFISKNSISLTTDPTNSSNASAGVGSVSGLIPYELMTYGLATLTSANHYTIDATAGAPQRRGVFGAPLIGQGVDHPTGMRFAFVGSGSPGVLTVTLNPNWIGKTLQFKFVQFNLWGGGHQSLANVSPYSFVPVGLTQALNAYANAVNYNLSPQFVLSQIKVRWTDLASIGMSKVLTSASGGFTPQLVGQTILILGSGNFVRGFYTISAYTSSNQISVTVDPTNGSNATAGTGTISSSTIVAQTLYSNNSVVLGGVVGPNSTHNYALCAIPTTAGFPTGTVSYLDRLILLPDSLLGMRAHVMVYDPNYVGEANIDWSDLTTDGLEDGIIGSVTGGFNASMVGQILNIQSGTHFVAGRYPITGVIDANHLQIAGSGDDGNAASGGVAGLIFQTYVDLISTSGAFANVQGIHVGIPGFTYLGSVYTASSSPGNDIVTPGGFPLSTHVSVDGTLLG